jgi:hypothetical protein
MAPRNGQQRPSALDDRFERALVLIDLAVLLLSFGD